MKKSASCAHMPPPSPLPHSREPSIPHCANTFFFFGSLWFDRLIEWDAGMHHPWALFTVKNLSIAAPTVTISDCSTPGKSELYIWQHFWMDEYGWMFESALYGNLYVTSLLNVLKCHYMLYMHCKTQVEINITAILAWDTVSHGVTWDSDARKAIEQVLRTYTICLFIMWKNVPEADVGAF